MAGNPYSGKTTKVVSPLLFGELMEYFSSTFGLTGEVDPVSENGQLFLVDYLFLLNMKGVEPKQQGWISDLLELQLLNSSTGIRGLYHRNPTLTARTMSHDNLSAIFAWSALGETRHRFEIWKYLITHLGTYDNTEGKSPQFSKHLPFNPSNYFAWGLSANSFLAYLFFPFFLINLIISCNKPAGDVSGKILSFVEMYPLRDNPLINLCYKYYTKKMTTMYGPDFHYKIRKIYHGGNSKDFPINKLVESVNG